MVSASLEDNISPYPAARCGDDSTGRMSWICRLGVRDFLIIEVVPKDQNRLEGALIEILIGPSLQWTICNNSLIRHCAP
jgi:hypothetical protein